MPPTASQRPHAASVLRQTAEPSNRACATADGIASPVPRVAWPARDITPAREYTVTDATADIVVVGGGVIGDQHRHAPGPHGSRRCCDRSRGRPRTAPRPRGRPPRCARSARLPAPPAAAAPGAARAGMWSAVLRWNASAVHDGSAAPQALTAPRTWLMSSVLEAHQRVAGAHHGEVVLAKRHCYYPASI